MWDFQLREYWRSIVLKKALNLITVPPPPPEIKILFFRTSKKIMAQFVRHGTYTDWRKTWPWSRFIQSWQESTYSLAEIRSIDHVFWRKKARFVKSAGFSMTSPASLFPCYIILNKKVACEEMENPTISSYCSKPPFYSHMSKWADFIRLVK